MQDACFIFSSFKNSHSRIIENGWVIAWNPTEEKPWFCLLHQVMSATAQIFAIWNMKCLPGHRQGDGKTKYSIMCAYETETGF